jgi:outer membrane protein OmpA-like peptidoglycan-associated protein
MRRHLFHLSLAALLGGTIGAQTPPKKPGRVKALVGKIADTAMTTAASTATDSLLGAKAAPVAGLLGAGPAPAPSCEAGLVFVPSPAAATAQPSPSAGSQIVNAARKRIGKSDSTAAAAPPASAQVQGTCVTAEQAAAMQGAAPPAQAASGSAEASAAPAAPGNGMPSIPGGLGSLGDGKKGMIVGGAVAAAPLAGKGLRKLGGMFGRGGPSRETVIRDLGRGRLQLKSVRFIEGSDALKEGFEPELSLIAEALQSVEGQFMLTVQGEADGKSAPDTVMVRRRLVKLATYLQVAGIPEGRVSVAGGLEASLTGKPAKPGDARVEVVRIPAEQKQ